MCPLNNSANGETRTSQWHLHPESWIRLTVLRGLSAIIPSHVQQTWQYNTTNRERRFLECICTQWVLYLLGSAMWYFWEKKIINTYIFYIFFSVLNRRGLLYFPLSTKCHPPSTGVIIFRQFVKENSLLFVLTRILQQRNVFPALTDIERKSDSFVWNFSPYWGQATYLEKRFSF